MKNRTLLTKVMSELISYGGYAVSRHTAYWDAHQAALSRFPADSPEGLAAARAAADLRAFSPPALTPEQAGQLLPAEEFKPIPNI